MNVEPAGDAQSAGDVERADAARRRVDDGVAVDAREARHRGVAELGRQGAGRDVRRRRGRRRPRRSGGGSRRSMLGVAASDDVIGTSEHRQPGAVREGQDRGARSPVTTAVHPLLISKSRPSSEKICSQGSRIAGERERPGHGGAPARRPIDRLETAPDGRRTEGVHAHDDTCVDICACRLGGRRRRRPGSRPRRSRRRRRAPGDRAAAASAVVKLIARRQRRDRVGEPGLREKPGPDAVAIEARPPEREPAELGERRRQHAGERDQKDRDHERAALHRVDHAACGPITPPRHRCARPTTLRDAPAVPRGVHELDRHEPGVGRRSRARSGRARRRRRRNRRDGSRPAATSERIGSDCAPTTRCRLPAAARRGSRCAPRSPASIVPLPSRSAVISTRSAATTREAGDARARRVVAGEAEIAVDLIDRPPRPRCRLGVRAGTLPGGDAAAQHAVMAGVPTSPSTMPIRSSMSVMPFIRRLAHRGRVRASFVRALGRPLRRNVTSAMMPAPRVDRGRALDGSRKPGTVAASTVVAGRRVGTARQRRELAPATPWYDRRRAPGASARRRAAAAREGRSRSSRGARARPCRRRRRAGDRDQTSRHRATDERASASTADVLAHVRPRSTVTRPRWFRRRLAWSAAPVDEHDGAVLAVAARREDEVAARVDVGDRGCRAATCAAPSGDRRRRRRRARRDSARHPRVKMSRTRAAEATARTRASCRSAAT